MLIKSIILFLVGGLNIAVGLLVLLRNYRKLQNILFFVFALSLAGWVIGIGGFLITHEEHVAFVWAKAYYSFPLLIVGSMALFSRSFPTGEHVSWRWWAPVLLGYVCLTVPLLLVHSFLTESLAYHSWGKEIVLNRQEYLIYGAYIIGCIGFGLVSVFLKSLRADGLVRKQLNFYFYGFLFTSVFGLFFNLILPWYGNYKLIWIGPLFTSFFVASIAYSIARHRLFDVRLVVARSLGYLLSLVVLASIYGFVVFGIAKFIFGMHISVLAQALLSAATGLAALMFHRVQRYFDKLTNRLFYRDAYDAQDLFNQLNQALVASLDLRHLLTQSLSIIETALKPDYVAIGLKEGEHGHRLFSTQKLKLSEDDINRVRELTPLVHHKVIIADLIDDPGSRELKELMVANNVAALVRLTQDARRTQEGLGYLILGNKRSGNPYNSQDTQVLDTVANELIIAIQNALHYEEIQNFNVTLQQKVDDATRQLRRANERLKQLDETKDDFISMASHQLRTPLTSVKGYISMVLEGDAGKISSTQRDMLEQAFFSSQRMVFLIADLLNVSRLKTGKFVIDPSPVNLADMIGEEVKQLEETAQSRSLELIYHKPEGFPPLMLDETKTRQVIMNFIDNAIYYTPEGGRINVKLLENPAAVELRVEDNGIGVPKSEQHHLFTKFYRAGNARKARPDGTGLGLFMAKKVIVAQGGAIIFESREGKGSTFGFALSKSKLAVPGRSAHPTEATSKI